MKKERERKIEKERVRERGHITDKNLHHSTPQASPYQ